MGKEGRQAVRCSDFAFARFRFLRRVLLVHGHWYYWRVSTLVQYFFYKNITFITPAVFFAIFSAYSTQVRSYKIEIFMQFSSILLSNIRCFAADLRYVFPDVLQHLFHIVAYFDFRPSRAKLYLASVAREPPSLQRHNKQRPYELVPVFQMDPFRCVNRS